MTALRPTAMMGALVLIAPPVDEPVAIEELKADLRVTHTDDDVQLGRLNAEAREWVETRTQRQLALKTWELVLDAFPAAEILLPLRPVVGVVAVKYDDAAGAEQTMPAAGYTVDTSSEPGWVLPVTTWPATSGGINRVRVEFTAGYSDYELIPRPLKSAIVVQAAELYDGPDSTRQVRLRDLLQNYLLMVA
jgi:uncharacterized phiE125 gp8 family phage protein